MNAVSKKPYPQLSNSPIGTEVSAPSSANFSRRPLGGRRGAFVAGAALSAAAVLTVQHLPSNPVDTSPNESRTQTELYSSAAVDKAAQDLAVAILANIPADTKCEGSSCLSGTMNTTKEPLNGATWKFEAAILDQDILEFVATQHDNKTVQGATSPASSRGVSVYFDISGVKKGQEDKSSGLDVTKIRETLLGPSAVPAFFHIHDGESYTSIKSRRMSQAPDKKATVELGTIGEEKNNRTFFEGTEDFDQALSQGLGDALLTLSSVKQTASDHTSYK